MHVNEDGGSGAGVTTGALARKLGISPTTLRSWDRRYGLGPATRIEGRHRRWTAGDVAMVEEMCRLTAQGVPPSEAARAAKAAVAEGSELAEPPAAEAPRPLVPSGGPEPVLDAAPGTAPSAREASRRCRGLARAAVRMDSDALHEQITSAVETYGLIAAWDKVLAPALRAVGRKWESAQDRYVEVEHLLSWHISAVLSHLYARCVDRNRSTDTHAVVLACLPGEQHTLPLEALTSVLAEQGRRVLMLGASVPVEALEATVRRMAPTAVALWSQSRSTANLPLARHLAALRWGIHGARTRSELLLCGPGWGLRSDPDLLRPHRLGDAAQIIASVGRRSDDGPSGHEPPASGSA